MNNESTKTENRILSEDAQQLPPDNGRGVEQTQTPHEDWFNLEYVEFSGLASRGTKMAQKPVQWIKFHKA